MYLRANQETLGKFRALRLVDCDFEEKDAYVYSLDDRGKIEKNSA